MALCRRISSHIPMRAVLAQGRNSLLVYASKQHSRHPIPVRSNQLLPQAEVIPSQVSLLHHSAPSMSVLQWFGFSSSASPKTTEKGNTESGTEHGTGGKTSGDTKVPKQTENQKGESGANLESESNMSQSVKRRRGGPKRTAFSDSESDSEDELSMEDLVKLVAEKEELLKAKHKEIEKMQDKVLRTYADMENVMDRTRREIDNSKKFSIQSFAKSLLDVADNLGRASSVVKESFLKIDVTTDTAGAVPLLKTLLEGVEMTEKQLAEVFRKFEVVKYDPTNEQFDPNRHNAVFQVTDASKPPGTIAVVLKAGYMLHDRVLRPAEVGVTTDQDSEA
ncbi:grpE protein homolog 2, mitochondrial-like isoform X1 [Diospyros lotus]|uniref:grpE protein homolog 2, mitochondrial-like isoform X1 n=1 Tax=Diospyros lotus TaxID=55363 RepID=UPI0022502E70|nr:grpE protein homolog 2, mitochondrial-like isoform X1 [Diospyros lotus]